MVWWPALLAVLAVGTCPEGVWVGAWTMPEGEARGLTVAIEATPSGELEGTAAGPGVDRSPLRALTHEGSVLRFEWGEGAGAAAFRGVVDAHCDTIAGTVRAGTTGVFHMQRRPSVHDDPAAQIWTTVGASGGPETSDITVYLLQRGDRWLAEVDATHNASTIKAYPADVRTDEHSDGVVLVEYPSGGGPATLALEPGPDRLSALWTLGRRQALIAMRRLPNAIVRCVEPGLPDLTARFQVEGGISPQAVAVLVGGSRSGGTPEIEQALRDAGMATLVPMLEGADFTARRRGLRRWVDWLGRRSDVDPLRIVLVGHGRGASLAARHAASFGDPVAALVLLSPPATSGRVQMQARIRDALEGTDPSQALDAWDTYVKYASQGVHREALEVAATAWVQASPFDADVDHRVALSQAIEASLNADWLEHMGYDPRVGFSRIRGIPVLAITGNQNPRFDGPAHLAMLEAVARERGIELDTRILAGLDHDLQSAGPHHDGAAATAVVQWLGEQIRLNESSEMVP